MMSAAGTPSTDPWVILARERARYEEQFKSLKPINGVVTGDQAKGFFLQSQLPPPVLGQIWALADTDVDGKMDINEFSIACKLINLKLRGFDIPKVLPPTLIASLKMSTPPAIPPLPAANLINNAPPRPDPPKPTISPQPLVGGVVPMMTAQPIVGTIPPMTQPVNIPTGVIPPIQNQMGMGAPFMPTMQGMAPLAPINTGIIPPKMSTTGIPPLTAPIAPITTVPLLSGVPPLPSTIPTGIAPLSASSIAPSMVPPGMAPLPTTASLSNATPPLVSAATTAPLAGVVTAPHMSPVGSIPPAGPGATSTPRASVTSLEKTASIDSPQVDWAVPHQTKLKYTQIFNTTDRTRSGYLSGVQARNVMMQTKLPQAILAQIWALADMDTDGRLGCEEFVLAMHLCEQASMGQTIPAKLPPDLVPPSFRRGTRTASISSQGSGTIIDQDPASTLLQTSFEDKRKENFEKGQAELERRRKALLDQQRKEAEERERKEREEIERREKARQEAERKRMEELERQMREQQEQERLKEEERKRQAEQREAARREMERQRQLEWEKQRLQELQLQRQREQENVLKLKAKNQSLTIELSTLNDQVKELSQKICDTRTGVTSVKATIDGMRTTRDTQMQEQNQLKQKLKEQNNKLLALSQEKAKLDAKNKMNQQGQDSEQTRLAFENKEVTIKNLKEKIDDMQKQIESKLMDIENNNSHLTDLKSQLTNLVNECETLYNIYDEKKSKVLQIKSSRRSIDYNSTWKDDSGWGTTDTQVTNWPVDNWGTTTTTTTTAAEAATTEATIVDNTFGDIVRYRALYEFVARNSDEISFQPGDIINVPTKQTGEPGWLAGEIRGHTGWFPESYVEPVDGVGIREAQPQVEEVVSKPLEEIAEIPETIDIAPATTVEISPVTCELENAECYIANYPYQSQEPGDLTFNAGDVIIVTKKDGDWWTGKLNDNIGIFPSNYVQKVDVNSTTNNTPSTAVVDNTSPAATVSISVAVNAASTTPISTNAAITTETTQIDNEVSEINNEVSEINENNKAVEKPMDSPATASQVSKSKKPEIASVIAPYQATSSEQLSLARGQLIMIRKKTDSGWWEGELQAKGRKRQVGWFPASYVKVLNSSGRISGRTTPVSTTRMQQEIIIDKVVALFSYTAANADELSFNKDDIISVTSREEEAWWKGELNGVSGFFPSNYVTPLQQQQ